MASNQRWLKVEKIIIEMPHWWHLDNFKIKITPYSQ
jgi:hypothetical protein